MPASLSPGSLVVEAARPPEDGDPLAPAAVFASTYRLVGEVGAGRPRYGRSDNAAWQALEAVLGRLEGGEATLFASGMAACVAALQPFLAPGDTLLMPSDGYYGVRNFAGELERMGVRVRMEPTATMAAADLAGVRLLWLETPSNPGLDCCDIEALSARAHMAGAKVVVDNTTPTPLGQTPLRLGADITVSADTKAVAGHSDVLVGHVTCRDPEDAERVRGWRTLTGAIPGPMATFLAHRGLATLDVRLARMCANANAVARRLQAHPRVAEVRYPGLPDDPAHATAMRQMRNAGFVVGVTFVDEASARACLERTRLVTEATSFGGVHSVGEQRARWGGDAVPWCFVRLSFGIEAGDDLLADFEEALA